MDPVPSTPIVWTIAGSDSGGGAGIQVDLKVMNAFGVHGCSAITAITAQNTLGVCSTEPMPGSLLKAQLEALGSDLPPAVIKTGMLGSLDTCRHLVEFLSLLPAPCPPIVCDPILKSTSGTPLLDPAALDLMIVGMFPHVAVLTPNLPEARKILGDQAVKVEGAAAGILETGAQSVLIKGGHADTAECQDYWTDGTQSLWLSSPRIDTSSTHGTGCILSAAIASAIALGQPVPEAVITAKTFLNQCLRSPANVGSGQGPMMIQPFRNDPQDRPTIR